jgi:carbohydrate-selective porin OprB
MLLHPSLTLVTDIAAYVTGGTSQDVTEAGNLGLNLFFDLEKLVGLSGASFLVSMSQRWGTSLSREHVGNVFHHPTGLWRPDFPSH